MHLTATCVSNTQTGHGPLHTFTHTIEKGWENTKEKSLVSSHLHFHSPYSDARLLVTVLALTTQ